MIKKQPLLIDLDGVLRIDGKPAPYVETFLSYIEESLLTACILSNATISCADQIKEFFSNNGIDLKIPVITASDATASFVKEKYKSASIYCSKEVEHLFADMKESESPEVVVVGDLQDNWTYEILNDMFNKLHNGADLVAMQINKFWNKPGSGLVLDAGAFIAGLEFATNKKATLVGKPSPLYFQSALKLLGYPDDSKFFMIGDDLSTDIKGANELGSKSILIMTGKTEKKDLVTSKVKPDFIVNDLEELVNKNLLK